MQFLRKLTLVASIFCLGLSPALADDDDLPTPEGLVEALEAVLAMEDGEGLSANTKLMLEVILFEEVIEGLDEEELAAAEEELQQFFEDLIADPEMPQDIRELLKEKLNEDEDDDDDYK